MLGVAKAGAFGVAKTAAQGPNNNIYSNAIVFGDFRAASGSVASFVFQIGDSMVTSRHASGIFYNNGWTVDIISPESAYGLFSVVGFSNYYDATNAVVVEMLIYKPSQGTYYPGLYLHDTAWAKGATCYLSNTYTSLKLDCAVAKDAGGAADTSFRPQFTGINDGQIYIRQTHRPSVPQLTVGTNNAGSAMANTAYGSPSLTLAVRNATQPFVRQKNQQVKAFGIWTYANYPAGGLASVLP